jgi:hypothetical protein
MHAQKEELMSGLVMVALTSLAAALVAFVCYLGFCMFVVVRTGDTAGLRDVAVAVRAFASVATLRIWRRP